MSQFSTNDQWIQLVHADNKYHAILQEFLKSPSRIETIKKELLSGERTSAITVATFLNTEDLKAIINELVFLASFVHGQIQTIRELILSLPKDWLIQNIEKAAEPILAKGSYEEYRRLLELYVQIDNDLLKRLVERALLSTDSDILEAGKDFEGKVQKTLYLSEIPSDSTIMAVKVENDTLKIAIELYTENKIEITFKEYLAVKLYDGGLGEIEAVGVKTGSNLLNETVTRLKKSEEPFEKIYSFQFGNSYEEYSIIEVIAKRIFIDGKDVNFSIS